MYNMLPHGPAQMSSMAFFNNLAMMQGGMSGSYDGYAHDASQFYIQPGMQVFASACRRLLKNTQLCADLPCGVVPEQGVSEQGNIYMHACMHACIYTYIHTYI